MLSGERERASVGDGDTRTESIDAEAFRYSRWLPRCQLLSLFLPRTLQTRLSLSLSLSVCLFVSLGSFLFISSLACKGPRYMCVVAHRRTRCSKLSTLDGDGDGGGGDGGGGTVE